jgi:hypothetical protein
MAARRAISTNLVSFLDVMCCGFGAVLMLVVILNASAVQRREAQSQDLRAEVQRAAALEEFARAELAQRGLEIAAVEQQQNQVNVQAEALQQRIRSATRTVQEAESRSQALQSSITSLRAQGAALEQQVAALRGKASQQWEGGKRPVGFSGDGQRQYLTGLKLGAERTLILVDASASMLDETVVNAVRWKLMEPEVRRTAPKWQRTVRTVHWLAANLRPGKQFQIYRFNTEAHALVAGTEGKWLNTDDAKQLSAAILAVRDFAPTAGTSLHQAFAVIEKLDPKPDSVILITDGYPTQGRIAERPRLVSEDERAAFFQDALRGLRGGIPINTLLLPMEGDPGAAGAFWKLAISSNGSFLTPSRDWP